jgi:hypothetical protein
MMSEFQGPVFVNSDSESDDSDLEELQDEDDFYVDEFFWSSLNSFQAGSLNPEFINRAIRHNGRYVFRLGNLGMTYDPELVIGICSDPDVLVTDTLIEMFARLRSIYHAHDEDVAYGIIDRFLAMYGMAITLKHFI